MNANTLIRKRDNLKEKIEKAKAELFKYEAQLEMLCELIADTGGDGDTQPPVTRQKKGSFKTQNPEIHDAIHTAVEQNPGSTLPEITDAAMLILDLDKDNKEQRETVYNIGHGLVRREQILREKGSKKLYPRKITDPSEREMKKN